MALQAKTNRSRRGLLAACILALLLVLFLSVFETRERGLTCAPLAPVSAEDRGPEDLDGPSTSPLSSPAEAPVVAPPKTSGASVAGRVVDERTRDGVPWITVEVRAGEVRSLTKTDAQGGFASFTTFAAGAIEIEITDEGNGYGVTKLDWSGLPNAKGLLIPIDIGPTFLVDRIGFDRVTPKSDWRLTLVESARPLGSAGEIEVRDELLEFVDQPDVVWSTVGLRFADRQGFARWAHVEHEPQVELLPRMELRSEVRCERGVTLVRGTQGVRELGGVAVESFFVLSGRVTADPETLKNARVLVMPRASSLRDTHSAPDFREVDAPGGRFTVELRGMQTYTVIAWADGYEPTVVDRSVRGPGREELRPHRLKRLLPSSFVLDARAFTDEVDSNDLQSLVRARVNETGTFARAVVFRPELHGLELHAKDLSRTLYRVDSIGIDDDPPTHGEAWTQVLPDFFAPEERVRLERAKPHRFEWIDPLLNVRRSDFAITAGPSGCIVTTKETGPNTRFTLVPDAPAYFTIWRGGSEPIAILTKDFVERDGERVAAFQPKPGWGVLISFRVVDSVDRGGQPEGARRSKKSQPPTFMEMLTFPPLPSVQVNSVQGGHGMSDEEGTLLVRSRLWPPRLSLRADGYRLRELRRMPGPGSRWIAFMEHDR